jgi:hypothetical protein
VPGIQQDSGEYQQTAVNIRLSLERSPREALHNSTASE